MAEKNIYQIQVKCYLDPSWSDWFDKWAIHNIGEKNTVLTSPPIDQEVLQGVLDKIIGDLNLPLISVKQLNDETQV